MLQIRPMLVRFNAGWQSGQYISKQRRRGLETGSFVRLFLSWIVWSIEILIPIISIFWIAFAGVGGMLLTPESIETPDADKKMIGSTFICEAASIAEVKEMVESDAYYTSDVVSVKCLFEKNACWSIDTVGSREDCDSALRGRHTDSLIFYQPISHMKGSECTICTVIYLSLARCFPAILSDCIAGSQSHEQVISLWSESVGCARLHQSWYQESVAYGLHHRSAESQVLRTSFPMITHLFTLWVRVSPLDVAMPFH